VLAGPAGQQISQTAQYPVPVGAPEGVLQFSVLDATSRNMIEYQQVMSQKPGSASEVTEFLNGLRGNNAAYVRVWRQEPAYQIAGHVLADPPASLALILKKTQPAAGLTLGGSKITELALGSIDGMVSGSKTVQVEIKK
jgi:hypothetical protein